MVPLLASTHATNHLTYLQAIVIGLLQGVTELFPISSLGHSVLIPSLIGGSWKQLVTAESKPESVYLAFLVGLHCATALALLAFFRAEWMRIFGGFFRLVRRRRIPEGDADARLAWLLIVATIPAGLTGLALEHTFRTLFAKPVSAAIFLTVNGLILFAGERVRRREEVVALAEREGVKDPGADGRVGAGESGHAGGAGGVGGGGLGGLARSERGPARRLDTMEWQEAGVIGLAQILALLAGISRSGITMVAGLARGLDHEDAARFAFLLATPIILAAGLYKVPDLMGPNGDGVRTQILVGSMVAAVAAYVSVRYLVRYFETRNLLPFALYCFVVGIGLTIFFGLGG